jgi:hypothetical protein
MVEELGATPGGEFTQGTELFEMIITPDERNGKLVEK